MAARGSSASPSTWRLTGRSEAVTAGRPSMTTSRIALVGLACLVAVGCGGSLSPPSTVPVTGSVLVNGKPVAGITVKFHPQFDMGSVKFIPNAMTDKDGRFTLNTAAPGDGAPKGEY